MTTLPIKGSSCNAFGVDYKHGKYERNNSCYKPEFLSVNLINCHCPNDNRIEFILSGGIYCFWFPSCFFFFCTSTKIIPPLWPVINVLNCNDWFAFLSCVPWKRSGDQYLHTALAQAWPVGWAYNPVQGVQVRPLPAAVKRHWNFGRSRRSKASSGAGFVADAGNK